MLSEDTIHLVGRVDQIVRDYFAANLSVDEIPSKDLMPLFIDKGVFKKNHRDGLPIRNLLRTLDSESKLDLLKHCKVVRNKVNRRWYFTRG